MMSGGDRNNGFNLDEEDRLPWLEPAGIEEEPEPISLLRVFALVAVGVLLLTVIVGGGYWLKNRDHSAADGSAQLIAAQSENYKTPANASDARSFDGEGDEAFAASEGQEASGRIDASRIPEAPRTDLQPAAEPVAPAVAPAKARPAVSAPVRDPQPAQPRAVEAAKPVEAAATGPRIQLGAFGSRAIAADVWKKHTGRFDYLSSLQHTVEPVETGGRTLYRLRASVASPSAANEICARLRVAGENCMVVR